MLKGLFGSTINANIVWVDHNSIEQISRTKSKYNETSMFILLKLYYKLVVIYRLPPSSIMILTVYEA